MNNEADWIPLMDYAMKTGVSLSTLRRHIKANKVPFKVEHGRYLLRLPQIQVAPAPAAPAASAAVSSSFEAQELRQRLQRAQEEIAELKMLVAIYEEQLAQQKNTQASGYHPRPNSMRLNGY